jgi:hypothetical protein
MTNTSRISAAPSADNAVRVTTHGGTPAIPPIFSGDTWGGAWGGAWGLTWTNATAPVAAVPASPVVDVSACITEAITASNTKRVTGI